MRFCLVRSQEQVELGRDEILLAGGGIDAIPVREVAQPKRPGQGVAAGVVADELYERASDEVRSGG
jgi:hypothetical protein